MELWIRSQNKGALIKVEMLGNTDGIIHSYLGVNKTILGEYKSNERALEVLDEIQKILKPQEYYIETGRGTFTKTSDISTYVYEMPKE